MTNTLPTHAILDRGSREHKAMKIEILTRAYTSLKMKRMLEVGCGSGFITSYFSEHGYGQDNAYAVDVADERQVREGYVFKQVDGTRLPFADGHFEFIISNHVIEHVGDLAAQIDHLNEVNRCLEPDGALYFAVPNRWRLIEPHYKLPFLSWIPSAAADWYMRLFGKGEAYDCRPLSFHEAEDLLRQCGFEPFDATLEAIPVMAKIERGTIMKGLAALPKWFWKALMPIVPTLIFVCKKSSVSGSGP